jgi:cation:H+ antiporter
MSIPILLFIAGLLLLIKGGDWFVESAAGIAHRFRIPEVLIGATVVSIGTTLPEVMVSAASAVSGHGEMAYGNAIGSIICNTALIAAITVAVRPAKAEPHTLLLPVIFFFAAAIFYSVTAYTFGYFSRITGLILLLIFSVYMFLSVKQALDTPNTESEPDEKASGSLIKELIFLVMGAALIAVGADLLVDNGTVIAEALCVPEAVIALTFISLGTSLPELVTSIVAARKGETGLAVGNVVGSNIFNMMFILGVSAMIHPVAVNLASMFDLIILIGISLMAFLFCANDGKIERNEGLVMVAVYAADMAFAILR